MSARAASWLAWSLAGLSFAMFAANIALYILTRATPVPSDWGTGGVIGNLLIPAPFLAFPIVGALIASRHPHNAVGWICLADGLLSILSDMIGYYSVYGVAKPGSVPFPVAIDALGQWLWVPSVGLLGTYVFLLFPDGRPPSRRWRPLAWLSGAVITSVSIGVALAPGPLAGFGGMQNPFGLLQPWMTPAFWVVLPLLPLCMLASALSLVLRYRSSGGEERQQIKWIAFAASFVALMYLIAMISAFVFPSGAWFAAGSPLWLDILAYAAILSFLAIPIAVGFAILRYRLYDIDLIINRTLVYGALTATLALIYFGGITATQAILQTFTGQEDLPQLAIVASTLVIAALFNPLRRRIQDFIDQRFYRQKYDAARTLEEFGARLRDETDLEDLAGDLISVVRDTVRPEHASLWLRSQEQPTEKRP